MIRRRNPTEFVYIDGEGWITREKKAASPVRRAVSAKYVFVMSCPDSTQEDIHALQASQDEVSRVSFARAIGPRQWREFQADHGYGRDFPIAGDWHNRYYRGVFRGADAYFVRHSRIEHIYTLGGEVGASLSTGRRNPSRGWRDAVLPVLFLLPLIPP